MIFQSSREVLQDLLRSWEDFQDFQRCREVLQIFRCRVTGFSVLSKMSLYFIHVLTKFSQIGVVHESHVSVCNEQALRICLKDSVFSPWRAFPSQPPWEILARGFFEKFPTLLTPLVASPPVKMGMEH